jgi:hypothetical protein
VTSGSITPSASGDLLWQWGVNTGGGGASPNSVSSFSSGSQANVSWQLLGTSLYDGNAAEAGTYNSTSAINPTFTSGTAESFTSCTMALKAAAAGNAPSQAFRIIHMLHEQAPASGTTRTVQFPTSGNLIVLSDISGGAAVSSITSSPANTWSSTGTPAGGEGVTALSQIEYAANATPSNAMTLSVTRSGAPTQDTFMMYDFVGAASSPFDGDSGGQAGNQTSTVSTFTTCSGCFTPATANEVIIGNAGWNWCTANGMSAPGGGLFDVATDTGNSVNGPQPVDQNNGWFHYYDTGTSAITVTWSPMACNQAEGEWAGRVAAFKPAGSVAQQPPQPPTQLTATVQ